MTWQVELKHSIILFILFIKQQIDRLKVYLGLATEKYGIYNPFMYKGVWFAGMVHSLERLEQCERYDKFRPDDVLVATYPKSGTHFTYEIIISIYKELGLVPRNLSETDATANFEIIRPALMGNSEKGKNEGAMIGVEAPKSPRILVSHLPWNLLPPKVREGKVKVICCSRNPKDVLCSAFTFLKKMRMLTVATKFSDLVQWYVEGNGIGGSYFEYMRQWYPYRNYSNVLNLQFEGMKKDLHGNVKRMAEFLNLELTNEQLQAIVDSNSFENKKKERGRNNPMYRKGKAGGWKSEITVEQNEMLDEWIQQEMKGLEDLQITYA